MRFQASADQDVNRLFERVTKELEERLNHPPEEALSLATDYYTNFTNKGYCASLGIPVLDDEFFFHEGAPAVALRIHYQLSLGGNPESTQFLEWRSQLLRSKDKKLQD